jgi:transcriptional repressor NrdR
MKCPACAGPDTQVKDSRVLEEGRAVRRRRVCLSCQFRFTTVERIQMRELMVRKKSGGRRPFDRDKLTRAIAIAVRKRPVKPETVERLVAGIVTRLENEGESEIPSTRIGEMVMEGLKTIDSVAYIRFASVYRDFREAKDFEKFVGDLSA